VITLPEEKGTAKKKKGPPKNQRGRRSEVGGGGLEKGRKVRSLYGRRATVKNERTGSVSIKSRSRIREGHRGRDNISDALLLENVEAGARWGVEKEKSHQ